MPDISMCMYVGCPSATSCRRSPESGTQSSGRWQSWMKFRPDETGRCEDYWPMVRDDKDD